MGSRNPPAYYDEVALAALELAFNATWAVMTAHDPFRDTNKDAELRTAIAEKLLALADQGVTNHHELRRLALEGFPLIAARALQ